MQTRACFILGALLLLGASLAGCGDRITAEDIVAKMQEATENMTDAHALVAVDLAAQAIEMPARVELWEKSPDLFRAEVLEASDPSLSGSVVVSDGQQTWFFDPVLNRVRVGPAAEIEMPLPQEALGSLQEAIQEVLDATEANLEGEEKIAGREAYRLSLSPVHGGAEEVLPGNGTVTLWVDKVDWIVLKAIYEAESFGRGSMELLSYELDPGLANELFTFEVPEGTQVVDVKEQQPEFMSLEEARHDASFTLLVPQYVPGDATLIQVFRVDETYVLGYDHSPDVSFTIMQGLGLARPLPTGEAQPISIRGLDGTLITDEAAGFTFLHWEEDGLAVAIAGRLTADQAIRLSESLE